MKTYNKVMKLSGVDRIVAVIQNDDGKEHMRLTVTAEWPSSQDFSKATRNMLVKKQSAGRTSVTVQKLISVDVVTNGELVGEEVKKILSSLEDTLGLDQGSLLCATWRIGTEKTTYDFLMTKEDLKLLHAFKGGRIMDPSDPHYAGPICCDCQYCGDKYSFPMPNGLLEVYPENLLLKVSYCCCGDCVLYGEDITPLGLTECECFEEL